MTHYKWGGVVEEEVKQNMRKKGELIDECSVKCQRDCVHFQASKYRFNECYWLRFEEFCTFPTEKGE